jgi:hypothetical protein
MRALGEDKFPPLTVAEHPEMFALGERIARYYQHPSQVHLATEYRRRQLRSVPCRRRRGCRRDPAGLRKDRNS